MLTFIFYFFIAIVVVQLSYYLGVFGKFAFIKPQNITPKRIPVSVIVCAKNEEENVKKYIPLLAEQNYPDFEIVLIDDASSDETLEVFEEFEQQYPNVRLVKVKNNEAFWGNKKYALTLGIKASKKEYLLFTDANCYPTSKEWITSMTSQFTMNKTIVLGYGGYEKIERSLLNKIIRFETVFTAVQYFSWTKLGFPYMGVGRNLAYKKEEFFNVNGFIEHIQVRSGDDDLFINQAANKNNTTIAYTPESFTYSKPKETYKEWFQQKRRRVSTTQYYKSFDKIQLGLFFISQLFFFILVILLLAFQFQWIAVLAILATRYTVAWTVIGFSAGKLKENDLKIWFPIVEIALIFTQINIFITNIFSKPVYWK
ncbi:glycosyl transferase family 2 [Flavobacterium aquidurense]|jgi:glycosyltransferase involved in cell wall biosynthesis|uniref:glycosyltransferase n=1 Tax=Flavobacterium aquidurense TaxID=362413 RepID=UPI00090F1B14|nr:glycosyltransferase [Flavobacterium aquidurense]OXA66489.1 glycosyl transferase family 2 [Flavobacterium aquidurense]SHH75136.1 Glycosyltransferase, catalytic subunit of cellulose synthase and poly-beta-1,6-N-acetylglucosamine synthase [Flavobacterium frigidimaris]